jgi:hypothetical protein
MRWAALALSVGCAATPPTAPSIVADFEALHAPVYQVFDLGPDRDAVHAHLAQAFAGESLTDAYVEHWRALIRMQAEATAVHISGVEYEDVRVLDMDDAGRVRVDASWLVRGVVTHQQHRHPRINRYRAVYTLAPTDDGWRITDTHMRDLARVSSVLTAQDVLGSGAGTGADAGFMDPLEMFNAGLFDAPKDAAAADGSKAAADPSTATPLSADAPTVAPAGAP